MQIYQIILSILEKPNAPKPYRELKNFYEQKGLTNEALALSHLIEKKFNKNNVITFNDSSDNPK